MNRFEQGGCGVPIGSTPDGMKLLTSSFRGTNPISFCRTNPNPLFDSCIIERDARSTVLPARGTRSLFTLSNSQRDRPGSLETALGEPGATISIGRLAQPWPYVTRTHVAVKSQISRYFLDRGQICRIPQYIDGTARH